MHRMKGSLALILVGIGFFVGGFVASSSLLFVAGGGVWAMALGLVVVARHRAREEAVMAALSEPPPPPRAEPTRIMPLIPAIPVAPIIQDNPFMTPLEEGVRSMFDLDWSDDEEITLQRA